MLTLEPNKPIPPIKDAAAALRTALIALRSSDVARHQLAFRLVGAADNQTNDLNAIKLLALLHHHGIGTKADSGAAVRTALDAVRAGDREAAEYVAHESPKAFASIAKAITSLKRLIDLPSPSVVKLSAPIVSMEGRNLTVGGSGDKPLSLELTTIVDKLKVGRVVTVAGVWANGKLAALVGEVPEPAVQFSWELLKKGVAGGTWQVKTVQVRFSNTGVQTIRNIRFHVRCWVNNGAINDHTCSEETGILRPGSSKTINVDFEMFNFQYIDDLSLPKASVAIDETSW